MQDKAIAAIGEWQLNENKNLEPVDLYIQNMFPGKDYQLLLLTFKIDDNFNCEYKGIDIQKVNPEDYKKYAYRKGSPRGGDITFTTKVSKPDYNKIQDEKDNPVYKKVNSIKTILEKTANNKINIKESEIFQAINNLFKEKETEIKKSILEIVDNLDKKTANTTGISFKILINDTEKYLRDFEIIKSDILKSATETKYKRQSPKAESITHNKLCSVSGNEEKYIYGFAAPLPYASPDKPGFISTFFNADKNWKNYPISSDSALKLELGSKYIMENLTGYFYGQEYLIVPNPIIKTEQDKLKTIIKRLKTAFDEEKKASREKRKGAEERVQKLIAQEKNYFNLDIAFFKRVQSSMKIQIMIEEVLPSRFRALFIEAPEKINKKSIFKNALYTKDSGHFDLKFSYQIVKEFFANDFLSIVRKLFLGSSLSNDFVFEHLMKKIQTNYNLGIQINWTIKKAIMLIAYLQELEIIHFNQNYSYMEVQNNENKETRFNLEGFNNFIKENSNFLDYDIKVGIFGVGVLVRFLFDIQSANLNNTPFENKLRGYKLNPELIMNVYTEALDKIQKYQKSFYVYTDLREILNRYFILNSHDLSKMTNNKISFYFVSGLELGKQFKKEKVIQEENE
jgi:CRISPR-associated protein Csh1